MLLDQFRVFPNGKHDDGPDALEMVLKVANQSGGMNMDVIMAASSAANDSRRRWWGPDGRSIIRYDDESLDDLCDVML